MLQAATAAHHAPIRSGPAVCPLWRAPRRRSRRQHSLGAFTWTGAANTGASLAPPSASPTFNAASGIAAQGAGLASAAGLFSGATGALGTVGAALPFVGAGLAAAGVGVNLIKCGTLTQRGCQKRQQAAAQNQAAQLLMQAAYAARDQGNPTAAAQYIQQAIAAAKGAAPGWATTAGGWGAYCNPKGNPPMNIPVTSTAAKILCGGCFTKCPTIPGTFHQKMTPQQAISMVQSVISGAASQPAGASGNPVSPGSPIQTSAAAASSSAAPAKSSSMIPLVIGGGALAALAFL